MYEHSTYITNSGNTRNIMAKLYTTFTSNISIHHLSTRTQYLCCVFRALNSTHLSLYHDIYMSNNIHVYNVRELVKFKIKYIVLVKIAVAYCSLSIEI